MRTHMLAPKALFALFLFIPRALPSPVCQALVQMQEAKGPFALSTLLAREGSETLVADLEYISQKNRPSGGSFA